MGGARNRQGDGVSGGAVGGGGGGEQTGELDNNGWGPMTANSI